MAEVVSMPRLSDTMNEGKVIKWYKKVGDKVFEGDILAEIETDKAIQDFEIDINGILLYIGVPEGKSAKVNDILAIIGESNENISSLISQK
ncbi:MAG: dihydrolipoamide acyltransferase, partial [Candidatus Bostrichicola ureolyticus]